MTYEMVCINGVVTPDLDAALTEAIKVRIVDNGIGSYEFWGQKCVDHRWEPEVEMDVRLRVRVVGSLDDESLRSVLDEALGGTRRVIVYGPHHQESVEDVQLVFSVKGWEDDTALVDVEAQLQ
jgi:hypothetical protein